MLSIEDQIGRIADAAFEETAPVAWARSRTKGDIVAGGGGDRHRARWAMLAAASVLAITLIGGLVLLEGDEGVLQVPPVGSPDPSLASTISSTADPVTSTNPSPSATTAPPTDVAPLPPGPLLVVPYGVSPTDDPFFHVRETNVNSAAASVDTAPGDVVLSYDVGIAFNPDGRDSTVVQMSPTSTDGQLAIEVSCETDGCLELEPVNDAVQTWIHVTVRRTETDLTEGAHSTPFEVHFDDGTIGTFAIGQFAEPEPSVAIAQQAAASSGPPSVIQEVFLQGGFAYHAIQAFDSIWVIDKSRGLVTRIDDTTGAVLATIEASAGGRLAASDKFVYTSGTPISRIDPSTNTATAIPGVNAIGITVTNDDVVFAGDYGTRQMQRVDPDGSVTIMDLPSDRWMDMTVAHGMVWALSQTRPISRLIAFDVGSGELRYDIPIDVKDDGYAVRLVADNTSVVVGADVGRGQGELFVIDPSTGTIVDNVALAVRPEGIVLTPNHIWTSRAILDRDTLEVLYEGSFGFTITRGRDGSIWGTGSVPSAQSGTSIASRTAPGDYRD